MSNTRPPKAVVVPHKVRVLQVHTFARRVGGEQDTRVLVVAEQLLHLAPIFAVDSTVDHHDGFMLAQKSPNPVGQIVQRVTVPGKVGQLERRLSVRFAKQIYPFSTLSRKPNL